MSSRVIETYDMLKYALDAKQKSDFILFYFRLNRGFSTFFIFSFAASVPSTYATETKITKSRKTSEKQRRMSSSIVVVSFRVDSLGRRRPDITKIAFVVAIVVVFNRVIRTRRADGRESVCILKFENARVCPRERGQIKETATARRGDGREYVF